jgi:hypothetical protein
LSRCDQARAFSRAARVGGFEQLASASLDGND